MDHNLKLSPDMDELLALHRDRWVRSHALSAAVAFHASRTNGTTASVNNVLGTAHAFEEYIRDGKAE